jgi:hypothetical protein
VKRLSAAFQYCTTYHIPECQKEKFQAARVPALRPLMVARETGLFCLSGVAAFLIRFEFLLPPPAVTGMLWAVASLGRPQVCRFRSPRAAQRLVALRLRS